MTTPLHDPTNEEIKAAIDKISIGHPNALFVSTEILKAFSLPRVGFYVLNQLTASGIIGDKLWELYNSCDRDIQKLLNKFEEIVAE